MFTTPRDSEVACASGGLSLTALVPNRPPGAFSGVRAGITEAAEKLLPSSFRHQLISPEGSPKPTRVSGLSIGLKVVADVNVAWEPDQLAQCLAARTAQSLCAELSAHANSVKALGFASRAGEYLAGFFERVGSRACVEQLVLRSLRGSAECCLRPPLCEPRFVDDAATGLAALHHVDLPILQKIILLGSRFGCDPCSASAREVSTAAADKGRKLPVRLRRA